MTRSTNQPPDQAPLIPSNGGLVAAVPLTRRDWSRLDRYSHAIQCARKAGDWGLVARMMRGAETIRTTIGDLALETRPQVLREFAEAESGLFDLRDPGPRPGDMDWIPNDPDEA